MRLNSANRTTVGHEVEATAGVLELARPGPTYGGSPVPESFTPALRPGHQGLWEQARQSFVLRRKYKALSAACPGGWPLTSDEYEAAVRAFRALRAKVRSMIGEGSSGRHETVLDTAAHARKGIETCS